MSNLKLLFNLTKSKFKFIIYYLVIISSLMLALFPIFFELSTEIVSKYIPLTMLVPCMLLSTSISNQKDSDGFLYHAIRFNIKSVITFKIIISLTLMLSIQLLIWSWFHIGIYSEVMGNTNIIINFFLSGTIFTTCMKYFSGNVQLETTCKRNYLQVEFRRILFFTIINNVFGFILSIASLYDGIERYHIYFQLVFTASTLLCIIYSALYIVKRSDELEMIT
jgi:hypothetical protein